MAISQDGAVYAMGLNNYGQLGLGDHEARPNAERIEKQWHVVDVAAGEHHSLHWMIKVSCIPLGDMILVNLAFKDCLREP